jgi:uncharacterized protein (TIGR02302 family)
MAKQMLAARAVPPVSDLPQRDPFGLRLMAALAVLVALLFGRDAPPVNGLLLSENSLAVAQGPSWEGWIQPPSYTGLPTLYLADQVDELLSISHGSEFILRFYGDADELRLSESVSGEATPTAEGTGGILEQRIPVLQNGALTIEGAEGRSWVVVVMPDQAPRVVVQGTPETNLDGQMSLAFEAADDYAVVSGQAEVWLDLAIEERRYGLALPPEVETSEIRDLPLPITGGRDSFTENWVENFSQHVWAHLPVQIRLEVRDDSGQIGRSERMRMLLPARRFFDPLAAAVIEQRRDLLWNRDNARRVAQIMRAISWQPEERLFRDEGSYLQFRSILLRLEGTFETGLDTRTRDELAAALWDLALKLEEGDIDDARERMQTAQDRLNEAMRNGASDTEIAELMQELREATQDYLRQLSRQAQSQQEDADEFDRSEAETDMQLDMNDLARMMDRIQELMEQGRMAEAQQALEELQQLMENMRVTQGDGQPTQGERAMEGLADTLRDQQGLSDQAFRDLQEQFNPGNGAGQSQQNEGRNGGQGRGQSHDGEGGFGQGNEDGAEDGAAGSGEGVGSLAERQQALRDSLNRQRQSLPGPGGPAGDAAREALRQAERAMEGAEESLRNDDLSGAIEQQAEAMNQMREGMRNFGEALAQQQGQSGSQSGQQGVRAAGQDPLGRSGPGAQDLGQRDEMLNGEDAYRRAQELRDEIQRRSSDTSRPEEEIDYLKRLFNRF